MLDARKNEVYAGLYKWEGTLFRKILPATAINPGELLEQIRGPVVLMGDATVTYKQLITDILKTNAIFAPPSKMSPSASTVAEMAIEKINQGTITDPISLTPFYIRKSEAEIRWKG
jgi:tRNA threonylcarbamoyladenosine biosynthesis protein TsaB